VDRLFPGGLHVEGNTTLALGFIEEMVHFLQHNRLKNGLHAGGQTGSRKLMPYMQPNHQAVHLQQLLLADFGLLLPRTNGAIRIHNCIIHEIGWGAMPSLPGAQRKLHLDNTAVVSQWRAHENPSCRSMAASRDPQTPLASQHNTKTAPLTDTKKDYRVKTRSTHQSPQSSWQTDE
jgi:hypothetical protein